MERHVLRIRFRKQGDLRLIGHRDLARTWERLFRRAGLALRMSEGYHPKARLSFPSALAVGIEGTDEVMEVELTRPVVTESLPRELNLHAPPGLTVSRIDVVDGDTARAQVKLVTYEIPVPAERQTMLRETIERLLQAPQWHVTRSGRTRPIDVRATLEGLELVDGTLRIRQRMTPAAAARPREILDALGLSDLERNGYWLTRSKVELAS